MISCADCDQCTWKYSSLDSSSLHTQHTRLEFSTFLSHQYYYYVWALGRGNTFGLDQQLSNNIPGDIIKDSYNIEHNFTKNCLEAIFKGKFKVEDSRSWAGNKNLCIKSSLIWSTVVGVGVDIIVRSWGWWRSRRIRVAIINTISTIFSCTIVSYLKAIIVIIIVADVVSRASTF